MKINELSGKRKPLYISRSLLNGQNIVDWAEENNIPDITPAKEMHVTIMFSKNPINPNDIDLNTEILTIPSGNRILDKFGKALVLRFPSQALGERWKLFRKMGASWDFESYMPHVTVSYDYAGTIKDIDKFVPYDGELLFGPEVMADLED